MLKNNIELDTINTNIVITEGLNLHLSRKREETT